MANPTCPLCSTQLQPVQAGPDSAPWVCQRDARGWWPAELTPQARALFDPATRDFGTTEASQMLRLEVLVNRDDARRRRVPEQPVRP